MITIEMLAADAALAGLTDEQKKCYRPYVKE